MLACEDADGIGTSEGTGLYTPALCAVVTQHFNDAGFQNHYLWKPIVDPGSALDSPFAVWAGGRVFGTWRRATRVNIRVGRFSATRRNNPTSGCRVIRPE